MSVLASLVSPSVLAPCARHTSLLAAGAAKRRLAAGGEGATPAPPSRVDSTGTHSSLSLSGWSAGVSWWWPLRGRPRNPLLWAVSSRWSRRVLDDRTSIPSSEPRTAAREQIPTDDPTTPRPDDEDGTPTVEGRRGGCLCRHTVPADRHRRPGLRRIREKRLWVRRAPLDKRRAVVRAPKC